VSWAATIVTVRLLEPADYGMISIAMAYLGLVALVNEFGLGTAIVTLQKLNREQVAQINSLSILLGMACFAISCAVSVPLANFFGDPQLQWVVVAMSAAFPMTAFRIVPYSLLEKELRFKILALIEGTQVLVQSLGTLLFAIQGLGHWALALGWLTGAAWSTCLALFWRRYHFAIPRLSSLREVAIFSRNIIIARLSWYAYSNADFIVAGKVLGRAAVGAYTLAWDLANVAIDKVSAQVGKVTPAFFSAVQNDEAALTRYLLKVTESLSMITIPITVGLLLVADVFVLTVLGEKWRSVIEPLRLLSIYASTRSITSLAPQILNVTGESRFVMYNNVIGAVLLPVLFFIGSFWGIAGIASAWLIWFPLIGAPVYWRLFRRIKISIPQYFGALRPAITASLAMAAVVILLRPTVGTYSVSVRLCLEILAGGASYIVALWIFHRQGVENLREVFRLLHSKASYVATESTESP